MNACSLLLAIMLGLLARMSAIEPLLSVTLSKTDVERRTDGIAVKVVNRSEVASKTSLFCIASIAAVGKQNTSLNRRTCGLAAHHMHRRIA